MIFEVTNIAFQLWGYPVSWIELVAVVLNLTAVILATRVNKLTWPVGLSAALLLTVLMYQVQLYSDMLLQLFFIGTSIYGWYTWQHSREKVLKVHKAVSSTWEMVVVALGTYLATLHVGFFFSKLHIILPQLFILPAASPYLAAFVFVSSIIATILLIKRAIETWYFWIAVNIIASVVYFSQGVYFLAFEYLIFLVTATLGFSSWTKQLKQK